MKQHKFLILFLFLLGELILSPFAGESGFPYYAFRILGIVVTVLSVYAVSFRRTLVIALVLLAIPASLRHTGLASREASALSIIVYLLGLVFDLLVVVSIFRRVFAKRVADSETIMGALCVYLLVGYGFSHLYMLVAALQPHTFYLDPLVHHHAAPDRLDLLYYSFATMTSLGAPGITPASAQVRSLTVTESLLGVLYLAVLVARLVSAYRGRIED